MQGVLHIARHLAIVALIVRALLPAGWMPDAHAGLAICSLDIQTSDTQAGVHLGIIHHDGGTSGDGHSGKTAHEECPFAAAPHLAATPDVPHLTAPVLHAFAAATDRAYAAVIAARFAPQSPRAPPSKA
ncbi:MAG TPA: DUF2946 family protein [Rhizomicrobium sp.]|jgi:hypothetical protein|nr:DUF2946 family protein [Rhizomicrobium sp.]